MRFIQLDTDCEGPLALNDNAFELCRDLLPPQGDRFFRQVSLYNDYLAKVAEKEGYNAVTTLKLILPFLKARGLTNAQIEEHARKTVALVPNAAEAYAFLHGRKFPLFAISTSFCQFAEAVGAKLGFDRDHILCTNLDLDRYHLSSAEAQELQRLQEEIAAAPTIELPSGATAAADLSAATHEGIAILDRIFGEQIPAMKIGAIYKEVTPLAGAGKAKAVSDSLTNTGLSLAETMYVGDSITDVEAFEAVRAGGGLSLSFNGNLAAVRAAEVVVVADCAWPIALLASIFQLWGKEGVLEMAIPETRAKSRALVLPEEVIEPIMMGLDGRNFNLYLSKGTNRDQLAKEGVAMQAKLRGEALAALG